MVMDGILFMKQHLDVAGISRMKSVNANRGTIARDQGGSPQIVATRVGLVSPDSHLDMHPIPLTVGIGSGS